MFPTAGIIRPFLLFLCTIITLATHPVISSSIDVTTFRYPSFHPKRTTGIVYSGDASASSNGGVIELTKTTYSVGRAVYSKPIRLHDRATGSIADFVTHFTFIIDSFNSDNKADGITFFLARTDYPALDSSTAGGYLGLVNDALNNLATNQIVAVEFDTFPNNWDPSVPNHMGIDVNSFVSKVTAPWQWDASSGRFQGAAQVWYSSKKKTLFARLTRINSNSSTAAESVWSVSLPIDLRTVLPEAVMVGFTGATGAYYELNQISSWNFTSRLCRSKSHQCA